MNESPKYETDAELCDRHRQRQRMTKELIELTEVEDEDNQ